MTEPPGPFEDPLVDPLVVEADHHDDEVVLSLTGELDPHTAPVLRSVLEAQVSDGTRTLVFDLSGLSFVDSSGLRVIIAAHHEMAARGGRLVLRSPSDMTRRILEITRLSDHVAVEA